MLFRSRLVRPSLTAIARDIVSYGRLAATMLGDAIEGRPVSNQETSRGELYPRASTGPTGG